MPPAEIQVTRPSWILNGTKSKADENLLKHGVSFEDAVTVFGDPLGITLPDPRHSESETRFLEVGRDAMARVLIVVYTSRRDRNRIISARRATRTEEKAYEEGES